MTGIKRSQYESVYYRTAQKSARLAFAISFAGHHLQQLSGSAADLHLWFLATDLTVRIFGAPLARRIIFAVMVPALAISYGISALFYMGEWQGFAALGTFNLFVARIAVASFMAYALGQILDVHVFNRLRQSRRWWLAPTASTLFGNISDTVAFFFIAFWRSPDPFMAAHWGEIALVDYSFKVLISIIFFLPMYGVLLNMLLKRLADKSDLSALQPS